MIFRQVPRERSPEDVSSLLEKHFSEIEAVTSEAGLAENCMKRIRKARRVVIDMVATIAFFFLTVRAKVEALSLSPQGERAVYDNLLPALYFRHVSKKAKRDSEATEASKAIRGAACPTSEEGWAIFCSRQRRKAAYRAGRPGVHSTISTVKFLRGGPRWPVGLEASQLASDKQPEAGSSDNDSQLLCEAS